MKDWGSLNDEEIINELTTIKGVGKWTVQMILMFRLGRTDVFPIDDLGIQQGMIQLYNIEENLTKKEFRKKLETLSEPWKPYRAIASRYIWKWKDAQKKEARK